MIVEPKIRNNTCLTSHPEGCAINIKNQIEYVRKQKRITGFRNVMVIGSSTGYGLSSRITAAFGAGAKTIGVAYEKPGKKNTTGTAGWYNTLSFEREAGKSGIPAFSINGDAFSHEVKDRAISLLNKHLGKVDLLVYSLASPRRLDPDTGRLYSSVIKPVGNAVTTKSLDLLKAQIINTTIEPATDEQVKDTVKVMGGEDWQLWINRLEGADLLAEGAQTIAYSYIGPEVTHPIYRYGTIGKAKEHLEATARRLDNRLRLFGGRAMVAVNKAVVTRASAVIPAVPLYISILYKVMKEKGFHEGCIEQSYRLFSDFISKKQPVLDSEGRIRLDDLELRNDVQEEVLRIWEKVNTENLASLTDIRHFQDDFYKFFGFRLSTVNYRVNIDTKRWMN